MHQTKSSTVFRPLVVPPHLEFLAPPEINYNFISLSLFQIAITASLSFLSALLPPPPLTSLHFPLFHHLQPSGPFLHLLPLHDSIPTLTFIPLHASAPLVFLTFYSTFILPLFTFSTLLSPLILFHSFTPSRFHFLLPGTTSFLPPLNSLRDSLSSPLFPPPLCFDFSVLFYRFHPLMLLSSLPPTPLFLPQCQYRRV